MFLEGMQKLFDSKTSFLSRADCSTSKMKVLKIDYRTVECYLPEQSECRNDKFRSVTTRPPERD